MPSTTPLFGTQTAQAVENFQISGERMPEVFLTVLAAIKAACAEVTVELGEMDAALGQAIAGAATEIYEGHHLDQFPVDIFQTGSGTSTNMNMNEVIASLVKERSNLDAHPNDDVNKGQSSNDVIPTALHVSSAVLVSTKLIPSLKELQKELEAKATQWQDIKKLGRTHLQDATEMTLGQQFSGYAHQVKKSNQRIAQSLDGLLELPIGGTAIGTGINAHPEFGQKVCERLSNTFNLAFRRAENPFEAQGARDAVLHVSAALRGCAASLSKIANDIRWLGSGPRAGLNELKIPALQPGSSIMPGKANPVICESVLQVYCQVIGNDTAILEASKLSNFELNVGMPVMTRNLLESIELLSNAASHLGKKCIAGLKANADQLNNYCERSLMIATRLTPHIGYDRAAEIAKKAEAENKSVAEVAREEGLSEDLLEKL